MIGSFEIIITIGAIDFICIVFTGSCSFSCRGLSLYALLSRVNFVKYLQRIKCWSSLLKSKMSSIGAIQIFIIADETQVQFIIFDFLTYFSLFYLICYWLWTHMKGFVTPFILFILTLRYFFKCLSLYLIRQIFL